MEIFNTSVTAEPEVPDPNDLPGLITRETRMLINDVVSCGFQPVITLVGLAGNILSMTVLTHLGFKEVTNILLIGLTTVDLLYLIMWYGPMAECIVRRIDEVSANTLEVEYKHMPIMVAAKLGTVSRLYTCLIAVERYIAVRHPLKAPALLTRKKIIIACLVLTVLPFVLGFQSYLLFDVQETFSTSHNATWKYITFSKFTVDNLQFVVLYNDLVMALPFNYLPIVVVTFCTASILTTLLRSHQTRLQMTAGRQDEKKAAEQRQVTKTLISICVVYVLCSLPSIAVQVARLLFQKEGFSDAGSLPPPVLRHHHHLPALQPRQLLRQLHLLHRLQPQVQRHCQERLMTHETRMLINDVVSCVFQPVITVVGLTGNILSLIVLTHLGFKEVSTLLVFGLTVVDLLYVIMQYGPMAECIARRIDEVSAINLEVEYKALPIMVAFKLGTASRLFTCLIAVERYIAVLHPLKAPALLTRKKFITASVLSTVLPFALGFNAFILFDVRETFSPRFNSTVKSLTFTQFTADNTDLVVLYNDLILALPFNYLPIVVVTFCTASILTTLLRSHQTRLQMTAGRQDEKKAAEQRQVTKTLISICVVYVLCSLPSIAVQVARLLFQKEGFSDTGRYRHLSFVTITISLLFSLVNSSVNFIFYIAFSHRFSATARKIFRCRKQS
ncbi:uncharacterized protein LOC143292336 [Babylonia areolata]|uniref:uncharacterized protein LOC143292336 n=1 Tax=Babylonia areolata TaxID=304850 RepID=UPI003FD3D4EF